MSKKQIVLLSLIVCLPLVLLGWLGVRLARDERNLVRQRVRDLLIEKLKETDQSIVGYFDELESDLLRVAEQVTVDTEELRTLIRAEPRISQLFVLDKEGRLLHPPLDAPRNQFEQDFLVRASAFLADKDLVRAGAEAEGAQGRAADARAATEYAITNGWYAWYWERGLNLILWRRGPDGQIVGFELSRARWMSDLIVVLPNTQFETSAVSRIALVDANDNLFHQWGDLEPDPDQQPFVELPLSEPLAPWRLKYYVAEEHFDALAGPSFYLNLLTALGVLGIGLVGLAFYFYRESSREIREAATRVNFVNQVSHELKTPLTNIRMYADLLENDLQALEANQQATDKAQQRLDVIVAESGRLSRLIGNVLTFARQQRRQASIKPRPGVVDEAIREVIRQFQPTLEQKGVQVEFNNQAGSRVEFDADVLEQILVNLFSNVEKYAADGGQLTLETNQDGDRTRITVADQGRGIPESEREQIFQPFYRAQRSLEEVTGAGIGLSIARNLARLHGGDIVLLPSEQGAVFQVELQTTPIAGSRS